MLKEIIDWIDKKPEFWKVALYRLIKNNSLSESDIRELIQICRVDAGVSKIPISIINTNEIRKLNGSSSPIGDIFLTRIHNIENINALSPTNNLEFSVKGLTAVYGDNGSGKSSYASVLKHACSTRGLRPQILGNIFKDESNSKERKAEISYTDNANVNNSVKLLNEEVDNQVLRKVSIFDTNSAINYIEKEDEIAYIPYGLLILDKFSIYLKEIEDYFIKRNEDLDKEKIDLLNIINPPEDSTARNFLSNLKSETSIKDLRQEMVWSKELSERRDHIRKKIVEIKTTDPQKQIINNNKRVRRFEVILNKIRKIEQGLNEDSYSKFKKITKELQETKDALTTFSDKIFNDLPLEGIGTNTWKKLWESARNFYTKNNQKTFPNTEDVCPLCLQELSPVSKDRFNSFEEFIQSDLQEKYNQAEIRHKQMVESLKQISFDFSEQDPILDELVEYIAKDKNEVFEYINWYKDLRANLLNFHEKDIDDFNNSTYAKLLSKEIEEYHESVAEINKKLQLESIDDLIKPLEIEINQLLGQNLIYQNRLIIVKEIYRLKRDADIKLCLKKCKTNSITTISNSLADIYVEKILKDEFKKELEKLGFNYFKIETETRGAKAKQYHFLKLSEVNNRDIKLKDILSEGEHRCISLATFFSELAIAEHNSSIVLDDPVSSLDHKWRYRIAKRLVEESVKRQVIIFTHDITFLLMLQELSESQNIELNVVNLTRKKLETGIVADNPPWDALSIKKRLGKLACDIQSLEKSERSETEEIYKEKVKVFYGKLRETWERLIEELLLNKVIQRFGREIQTQRLKVLTDLTDADYEIIDSNMSKCSVYFNGHDTSGTLIEQMPNVTEVKKDLQSINDYVGVLRNRKRN